MNKSIQKLSLCFIAIACFFIPRTFGQSFSFTVNTSSPICAGGTLTINYAGATVGDTLVYTLSTSLGTFPGVDSGIVKANTANGTINYLLPSSLPSSTSYVINVRSKGGNFNPSQNSAQFTINALPVFTLNQAGNNTYCAGNTTPTSFNVSAGTGATFEWYRNSTLITPAVTSANFTPTQSGAYSVKVTQNGCSVMSTANTITINSSPTANFTFTNNNTCAGTPIQFNGSGTGGTGPYTFSWNFNSGSNPPSGAPGTSTVQNPQVTFGPVSGNGTVSYSVTFQVTDQNNCSSQINNSIVVKQKPDFVLTSAPLSGQGFSWLPSQNLFRKCSISSSPTLQLLLTSSSVVTGNINWGNLSPDTYYSYPGTANAIIGSSIYNNQGQYSLIVSGTNALGCITNNTYIVYYGTNPSIGLANPGSTTGECTPKSYQFPLTTFSANSPGTTYTVTSNDGTSPIIFNHPPPSSFIKTFTGSSCGAIGNTTSGNNTYYVRVTATNFCNSTSATVEPITLNEPPIPLIQLQDTVICNFSPFNIYDISRSGRVVNYSAPNYICDTSSVSYWKIHPRNGWSLLNGTSIGDSVLESGGSNSLNISFTQPGIYRVYLFKSNFYGECGWTSTDTAFCVQPTPYPKFNVSGNPVSSCKPVLFSLTNISNTLSSCGLTKYKWNVEVGSNLSNLTPANLSDFQFISSTDSSINAQIKILKAGQYGFRLSITNKCGTRDTVIFVTVRDKPIVTISPAVEYCGSQQLSFNSTNHTATVNNQFGATGPTYSWTLSGSPTGTSSGINSSTPSFNLPGDPTQTVYYRIKLSVNNECGLDSTSQVVTIKPNPQLILKSKTRQICNSTLYRDTLGVSNGLSGVLYSWTVSPSAATIQGAIAQITPISNNFVQQTLTNTGTTQGFVDYIYSATLNGCKSKSDTVRVLVDPLPSAANAGSDQDLCLGSPVTLNAAPITVGTGTWMRVSGPGSMTITSPNQASTTVTGLTAGVHVFRWTVVSGVCSTNLDEVMIRVFTPPSVAEAGPSAYLCNQTNVTLAAQQPAIGSGKWVLVSGPSASVTFANDTVFNTVVSGLQTSATTQYIFRWTLTNGPCPSTTDTVHVWNYPASNPGTLAGITPICFGNTTTLTVSGNTGSILRWESSPAGANTWTPISNTTNTLITPTLTQNTDFRVVVQSGGICSSVNGPTYTVSVSPRSVGGVLSGSTTQCAGQNSGTLTLSGQTGNVVRWEQMISPSTTWSTVLNQTGTSLNWSNLNQTTRFRVIVKSGVCPDTTSAEAIITINPQPSQAIAGSNQVLCSQSSTTLAAQIPLVGTGVWSQQGSLPNLASIVDNTASNTQVNNLIPGNYTFVWTVTNGVCSPSSSSVQIQILPTIANNSIASNQTICSGFTPNGLTGSTPSGGNGTYQYQWESSTTSATLGFTPISGATASFHNPGPLTNTTWYRRMVKSGPCVDSSASIKITVEPAISNNQITGPAPICTGNIPALINGSVPTGGNGTTYQYQWEMAIGTTGGTWTSIALANSQTYQPTALTTTTRFRRLVTSSTCSIPNISNEVTIIVNPLPNVTVGSSITLCLNSSPTTLTASPTGGIWSGSSLVNSITGVFTPSAVIPSTQVTYTYTDGNGCIASNSLSIQVISLPIVNAGTGLHYCQNSGPQSLNGFSPVGGTWSGSGVNSQGVFNPNGLTPGMYILTYSFSGGGNNCSNSDTIHVWVDPKNSPVISNVSPQCPFSSANINVSIANGINSPLYTWTVTNNQGLSNSILNSTTTAQPQITLPEWQGSSTVVYLLSLSVINEFGCLDTVSTTVQLRPRPNILASLPTVNCGPAQSQVVNTTTGNNLYSWSISPNSANVLQSNTANPIIQYPVNNNASAVVYSLTGIATDLNGCKDTILISNTIYPKPVAKIILSDTTACTPTTITATNQSIPNSGLNLNWQLPSGGSSNQNSVTINLSNTTFSPISYPVVLFVESVQGCRDTANSSIKIYPVSKSDFSANLYTSCAPFVIGGSNITLITYPNANSNYIWNFINTAGSIILSQSGTTPPNYTISNPNDTVIVQLITTNQNGCKADTLQRTFRTIPNPIPNFIASPNSGCSPQLFTIQNTSSVGVNSKWNFGWQYQRVTPAAGSNDTVTLANISTSQDSTYKIKLVVTAGTGCRDSVEKTVTVNARPKANFNFQQIVYCAGSGPIGIQNLSQAPVLSTYRWRVLNSRSVIISDSTSNQPTFLFPDNQSGTDTIYRILLLLKSLSGCEDTLSKTIRIQSRPSVSISIPAGNCAPLTLSLTSQVSVSTNSSSSSLQYQWISQQGGSFNTPNAANSQWTVPVNLGPLKLDYPIKLVVTDNLGCKDSTSSVKSVFPKPIANFQLTADSSCSPFQLGIQNTSNAQNNEPINSLQFSWNWNGISSSSQIPTIQLTNTGVIDSVYRINLQVTSQHGCVDTISKPVKVFPDARANLIHQNLSSCAPFQIDNSQVSAVAFPFANGTYNWYINGNFLSNLQTFPGYTINLPNNSVDIKLVVNSLKGCKKDSTTLNFSTIPNPIPSFIVNPIAGCSPQIFSIQNTSSVGVNSKWSFGWQYQRVTPAAGTTDTVTLANSSTTQDSIYKIKLVVTAGSGCRDSLEQTVTVNARPKANFNFQQAAYCAGSGPVGIQNLSQAPSPSTYRWRVLNSRSVIISDSTSNQPTFLFPDNQSGTDTIYRILLLVKSLSGCEDTLSKIIRIQSRPSVSISIPVGNCAPLTLSLTSQVSVSTNSSSSSLQYQWISQQGGSFNTPNAANSQWTVPVNLGPLKLDYPIKLVVTDNLGCKDSSSSVKSIFPKPIANFQLSTDTSCSPFQLSIQNTSNAQNNEPINSLQFSWNWNGLSSSSQIPTIQLTNTGVIDSVYRINLQVSSQHGCVDTISKSVKVFPDARANLLFNSSLECAPFVITSSQLAVSPYPQANGIYRWFVNGQSIGNGISFPGYTIQLPADSAKIEVKVSSLHGCRPDSTNTWFRTIPNPKPLFQLIDTVNCTPFQITTINQTPNSSQMNFVWKFEDNRPPINSINVQPIFLNSDSIDKSYWIRLIAIAGTGCKDSIEHSIVVKPLPRPRFSILDSTVCFPIDAVLTNASGTTPPITQNSFLWWVNPSSGLTFSNDTSSNNTSLSFPDNQSGVNKNYTIWLKAKSDFGCIDSINRNLIIPSRPKAIFATNPDSSCGPAQITLQQQSLYGQTAFWSGSNSLTFAQPNQWSTQVSAPAHFGVVDSVYSIKLLVSNSEGCIDSTTRTLRIFPLPKSRFISQPDSGCGPLSVSFTDSSIGQLPLQYRWNFDDGNFSTLQNPTHSFVSSRYQDSIYNVKLITTSGKGCIDSTSSQIRVKPGPTAVLKISDTLLCTTPTNPARFTLRNLSFGLVDTFYWDFGDGSPLRVLTQADTVQHTYLNDGFYWIKLKAVNACNISFDSVKIAVLEKPKPSFTLDSVGCGPLTITPINTTPNILTTYVWDFGNGQNSTLKQPGPITLLPNPNRTDTVYVVKLTAMNICDTAVFVDSVLVRPKPTAIFSPDTTIGCSPFRLDIYNYSLGAPNTYYWDFGNGDKDTTYSLSTFRYVYHTSRVDTFKLKMVAVNECGSDSMQYNIVVFPNTVFPQLIVDGTEKFGCAPHTVRFYNASIGANVFRWKFNDGSSTLVTNRFPDTVLHTFQQAGTYTVEMEASNGCSDTSTFETVVVYPKPIARFITTNNTLCVGDTLKMINQSSGASLFQWYFGDGTTSLLPNPKKVYSQAGNYTIKLIVSQTSPPGVTCMDTFFQPIIIRPLPTPVLNLNLSQVNCQPYPLIGQVSGANVLFANWKFGDTVNTVNDTASGLNVRYLYSQPGTFVVKVKAFSSYGCIDSISAPVQVTPSPKVVFNASRLDSCGPFTVVFTNQTTNLAPGFVTYKWFVDGQLKASSLNFTYQFTIPNAQQSPKSYLVQLVATNGFGCSDTASKTIRVFPDAKAIYSLPQYTACAPFSITPSNLSLASNQFKWYLDNQLIDTTQNINYLITTPNDTFELKLVAISQYGCKSDTAVSTLITLPKPTSSFTPAPTNGCAPLTVNFQQQSINAVSYSWNLGNGGVSNLPSPQSLYVASLNSDTTYTVRLIVKNTFNCSDTSTKSVTVHPDPIASLIILPSQGCSPLNVQIQQNGWQNATTKILFGDGLDTLLSGNWNSINHVYSSPAVLRDTVYKVTVFANSTYGCKDTVNYSVVVHPDPIPDFTWSPQIPCEGDSVRFQNTSQGGGTYSWNFGNGLVSTSQNPSVLFTTSPQTDTTFTITLTQVNAFGCTKSKIKTIELKAKPLAKFAMSDSIGCSGTLTVQFTNTSQHATRYLWLFGDGSQPSTAVNPSHFYAQPNVYIVTLIVFSGNGCSDTTYGTVSITYRAQALFTTDINKGCEIVTTRFSNLSTNSQSFLWDFGDGITSTDRNPTHAFNYINSPYTVKLIAYGMFGCNDTLVKPALITVYQPPVAEFMVEGYDSVKVQPDRTFKFINQSVFPPLTYRWDFGDGSSFSLDENPVHTYSDTGKYQVQLIAKTNQGCFDTAYHQVQIDTAECYLWIPTAFIPDQDQLKDEVQYFRAVGKNLKTFKISIFNKWGELVFESEELEDGKPKDFWDGTRTDQSGKKEICKQDVYVWRVEATFVNGDTWPGQEVEFGILKKSGTVTLIR